MRKITLLFLLFFSIHASSQEFTPSVSAILVNGNWETQDSAQEFLKRVTFYPEKGVGFAYNKTAAYYAYEDWEISGSIFSLQNTGGYAFKIEFNETKTKVKYLFITIDKQPDKGPGEVAGKTTFRFEF